MLWEACHELPASCDRAPVFRDRAYAGEVLAGMLSGYWGKGAIVPAIPAGGGSQRQILPAQMLARYAPPGLADAVYCANVRGGLGFVVAEAYETWYDVSEDKAGSILARVAAAHEPGSIGGATYAN